MDTSSSFSSSFDTATDTATAVVAVVETTTTATVLLTGLGSKNLQIPFVRDYCDTFILTDTTRSIAPIMLNHPQLN